MPEQTGSKTKSTPATNAPKPPSTPRKTAAQLLAEKGGPSKHPTVRATKTKAPRAPRPAVRAATGGKQPIVGFRVPVDVPEVGKAMRKHKLILRKYLRERWTACQRTGNFPAAKIAEGEKTVTSAMFVPQEMADQIAKAVAGGLNFSAWVTHEARAWKAPAAAPAKA
jgi:hypothetical protein